MAVSGIGMPSALAINAVGSTESVSSVNETEPNKVVKPAWKLSTLASKSLATVGLKAAKSVSAVGVQVLIPVSPKSSWNGSGSSALAAGASPISAAAKATPAAITMPVGVVMISSPL